MSTNLIREKKNRLAIKILEKKPNNHITFQRLVHRKIKVCYYLLIITSLQTHMVLLFLLMENKITNFFKNHYASFQ